MTTLMRMIINDGHYMFTGVCLHSQSFWVMLVPLLNCFLGIQTCFHFCSLPNTHCGRFLYNGGLYQFDVCHANWF